MTEHTKRSDEGVQETVSFARTLGAFDASMIGIGAMIGAGIFVLTGIACGEAGPAAILAFGLNGVVTLITAMAYAELASSIPRAGGGYAYVKQAFPDVFGFVAGWWLWFAYTVACALYAAGFGSYFLEFLAHYFPATASFLVTTFGQHGAQVFWIGVSTLTFSALNAKGAAVTGKAENVMVVAKIAVLVMFIIYGAEAMLSDLPRAKMEFEPFFPKGTGGVFIAMGLTFIAFEGYDLIATVAEEIKDPGRNIPLATFVSVGVTVVIYLSVLLVALGAVHPDDMKSYEFLGKYQETAIVQAAQSMMPGVGVFLIVLGGVLSTVSALNATVMASSRVAFSMARDGWLPKRLGQIHPKSRTPAAAIWVTGLIFGFSAVVLPVNALGSATSIMFLLVFALVNLSVIAIRRKVPNLKRPFRTPGYPVLPIAGFVINLSLALYQFAFDFKPWMFMAGWTVTGLLFYFALFARKTTEAAPLVVETAGFVRKECYRILVPLSNPHTVDALIDLAGALARQRDGEVVALTVAKVPVQTPLSEGMKMVQHSRPLLRAAKARAEKLGIPLSTKLYLAHDPGKAIIDAVREHRADLLVMGWKGFANTRDRIFGQITDQMIRLCPCDLALARVVKGAPKKILLATSGGPNATLGAGICNGLNTLFDARTSACVVVKKEADKQAEEAAVARVADSVAALDLSEQGGTQVTRADSVPAGISRAAKPFDLVVIGAAPVKPFKQMLLGDIPGKVARFSPTQVVVIRKWQGPLSGFFRQLFG